ncbi:MAG: ATP-binding protein, partial [Chthoniobacterales bacterium]
QLQKLFFQAPICASFTKSPAHPNTRGSGGLNLLINAIEAMSEVSEGPRELWVSSQKFTKMAAREPGALQTGEAEEDVLAAGALAEAEGTHVLIGVRDSGPGLDPKGLDRLFDAFYTTKPQGLGMGLAISRSIMRRRHETEFNAR